MTTTAAAPGLTRIQALEIAGTTIKDLSSQHAFVIQEELTTERAFGWVFFYSTQKYLETRDPQYLVPGNAPLVVQRRDGSVEHLPASIPPARAIEIFEKRWEDSQRTPGPPATK